MRSPTEATLLSRWWACSRIPLGFSALFSLFVLTNRSTDQAVVGRFGMTTLALVLFYFAAGASVGSVVLLSSGWATTRWRGGLLGFLVGTMVGLALNFLLPEGVRGLSAIVPASGLGLILGFPAGALYWKRPSV